MSGNGQQTYSAAHDARAHELLGGNAAWNFDAVPGEWHVPSPSPLTLSRDPHAHLRPNPAQLPDSAALDAPHALDPHDDHPASSSTFTGSPQPQGRSGEAGVAEPAWGRGAAASHAAGGQASMPTIYPATAPVPQATHAESVDDIASRSRQSPNTAPAGGSQSRRRRGPRDDLDLLASDPLASADPTTTADHHHQLHRSSSYGFDDHLFSDIDDRDPAAFDLGLFSEAEAMPSTRHSTRRTSGGDVVDLTSATSPAPLADEEGRPLRKRGRVEDPTTASSSGSKRPRPARTTAVTSARATPDPDHEVETLDLTENPRLDPDLLLLAAEQTKTILQQNAPNAAVGPQRLGRHTCPICLGELTDASVTVCGHLHCHECLWQAIRAGERTSERKTGNCPVCRKGLSVSGKKKGAGGVVAVNFLTRKGWEAGQGRRRVEEL